MKVTYADRIQTKTAYNRKKYCICGEHEYTIVEQLFPFTPFPWFIRCPYCGHESYRWATKQGAIADWKSQGGIYGTN